MSKSEIKALSLATNQAVVHLPDRKFPGSVIQGDSLSVLVGLASSVQKKIHSLSNLDEECRDEIDELVELLEGRLNFYEDILSENGMELPYSRREIDS